MSSGDHDDWHAIVDALNRLATIFDERQWDSLEEVLLPDANAYGAQGIAAILATNLRRYLGGCGPSQHLLGNYQISVDGDSATSHTKVRAFHQGREPHADKTFVSMGVYHDRWVRTAQGWRMSERVMQVDMNLGDWSVLQPG